MHMERAIDVRPSQIGSAPAEEDLADLFSVSHDLACIVGLDGCFCFASPAWELCLGWTAEDLIARPFLDFIHPDDRASTVAEMRRVPGSGGLVSFETRFSGKDGADRRLHWNATFSPQRRAICASARDVTGRKRLERELIEAGDRERERIGRELHDGLCQNLAGIAALSATLARKLAARDDPAATAAADLTVLMQQAVGDARDLARGLNPPGLAQMGLAMTLEALAANVGALHPVACAFACDRRFPRLDPAVEAHLYRIAQEAVNNAVAHGRGKRIDISLRIRNGQGSLRIRDNGRGISPASGAEGVGLHTMDYRARMIGASLHVQRVEPHGTMVACAFPLSSQPAKERRHVGKRA
jgi:PAS domain S-box-containing protein